MNIFQSIILSVVEGITEFLPISSTGHLIIATKILGIEQTEFVKSYEIIIQLGAILAVAVIYFNELIKNKYIWYKTLFAFVPSAILGLVLYRVVKHFLIGNYTVTAVMLIVGGIAFILLETYLNKKSAVNKTKELSISELNIKNAVLIGLSQSIAMIPGVSRSAASIFGGMLVGLKKEESVKFSFFLAIPTMLSASALDLYKSGSNFTSDNFVVLGVGFIGAFITAFFAVKFFISYIQRNSFKVFGVYRIIAGIIFLMLK